ncbi:PcfJ domain-containing protein [Blautia massiliensis (ex Durand et al. 2017)]|uniref:PcfJ domain-containing protein n=1 Tax=Blautia massiliensis (ex Durand et al. 2017) TaxID=1737424 RepID=UPI0022E1D27A|nr:PcfJ domain-containing protein [Blautia massiliensis (ex Durand et al. 2017)]
MRKKMLMELKPLKVMSRYIADAKESEKSLIKEKGEKGKYRMYCRAAIEKGILKVNLFAVSDIEENVKFPRYRLFISRTERRFITYDEKLKKWRAALLESILWDAMINFYNIYVNDRDTKVIQIYLKTMRPAIWALEEYQANIRKEQRIRHDKKLTDSWDQVMKTVPGLPKNWIAWVSKYGIMEHYIFYKYQKNGATNGYCTYCKKHVPIRSPKYNQKGHCNICGQPVTFRSVGKSGRFCTKWYRVYLVQRRKTSGFVIRIFQARTWYKKAGYADCETTCHEEQRRIFSANGKEISNFVYGLFKRREMRWILYWKPWYYTCCGIQYKGNVYPYTLSDLSRHELKETGLREYALRQKKIDPGKYLYLWQTYPVLEQIVKAGLFQLVDDILEYRATDAIKRKGRKPTEFLSVTKKEFRRLRDMNGGAKELKWLQFEKSSGRIIKDEEIYWMAKEELEPKDLQFVLDRMSICQVRHYLVKQSEKSGDDISHILQVWKDYLSMAGKLRLDVYDSIIYRTSDLQRRHSEAVIQMEEKKKEIRRRELEEKYVGFQEQLIALKEKYEFSAGEYQIVAPKSIDDILYEGDTLHHCVNKTDNYFDRIASKESYILFLRKKENPEVPFYTLEAEPDGTIRQKRAEFDRQNKDIDEVTSFLRLWQKEIQKRLTKKDYMSAEKSRKLRQRKYQEVRDQHIVVHGGEFAGKLLADLLEKDLMGIPLEDSEKKEERLSLMVA